MSLVISCKAIAATRMYFAAKEPRFSGMDFFLKETEIQLHSPNAREILLKRHLRCSRTGISELRRFLPSRVRDIHSTCWKSSGAGRQKGYAGYQSMLTPVNRFRMKCSKP